MPNVRHGSATLLLLILHGGTCVVERRCDVEEFGAVADDGRSDHAAILAALRACGGAAGGEIVMHGPGVYESAPLNLTSNQVLHVAVGAVLRAPLVDTDGHCHDARSPCPYPIMDRFPSYQSSRSGFGCRLGPFIGAYKQHNITITGGGTIDGNGQWWWELRQMKSLRIERPRLVELQFVTGLDIGPIVLRNSPYWTLHPIYCRDVHIHDIQITADDGKGGWGYNTDGIDPDSCKDVLIENYVYNAGDDAIAVKSGWNYAGYTFNMSSENILARNCSSNGRGGYTIGSEMSGGVRNVTFEDSTSTGVAGIRISSQPGRGGYVKDVHFRRLDFRWKDSAAGSIGTAPAKSTGCNVNPHAPFLFHINQAYRSDNKNTSVVSKFSDFVFEDISVSGPAGVQVGDFVGGAVPITGVAIRNLSVSGEMAMHSRSPMCCYNVSLTASDVAPPSVMCDHVTTSM
jgi:polygalacturonase